MEDPYDRGIHSRRGILVESLSDLKIPIMVTGCANAKNSFKQQKLMGKYGKTLALVETSEVSVVLTAGSATRLGLLSSSASGICLFLHHTVKMDF